MAGKKRARRRRRADLSGFTVVITAAEDAAPALAYRALYEEFLRWRRRRAEAEGPEKLSE